MKKVFYFLSFVALTAFGFMNSAYAQIQTPAPSPKATITQQFGLSEITVEYSRPSAKGRTIFAADGLVPHGKLWRTGANQATKITFGDDVTVGGKALSAGSYAVLTTPSATSWDIHFFNYDKSSWSSYRDASPAVTITANTNAFPGHVETFLILIADITAETAKLEFVWDKTIVAVDIKSEVKSKVMAQIQRMEHVKRSIAVVTQLESWNSSIHL